MVDIKFWKRIAWFGRKQRHGGETQATRIYQKKLRKDAVDILDMLDYSSEPIYLQEEEMPVWKKVKWSDFKNVFHLGFEDLHLSRDDGGDLIRADLQPKDLNRDLDVSFSVTTTGSEMPAFARIRFASAKEVRGRVLRPFPVMAIAYTTFFDEPTKRWVGDKQIFGYIRGGWTMIEKPTVRMTGNGSRYKEYSLFHGASQQDAERVQLALGISLLQDNNWFAYFGHDSSFRIGVPVAAGSIPTLFKERKKSGNRRKTLRTWVREHSRIVPTQDLEEHERVTTQVRTHMRGAEHFSWNGLNVQLQPAHIETEADRQIAEAKEQERRTKPAMLVRQ